MDLKQAQSITNRVTDTLGDVLRTHQATDLLIRQISARDIKTELAQAEFPDGQGGTIPDADTPVPALNNLTINQLIASIEALEALTTFLEATIEEPVPGGDVITTALAVTTI